MIIVDDFKSCFDVQASQDRFFFRTIDSVIGWDENLQQKIWEYELDGDKISGKKEIFQYQDLVITMLYDNKKSATLKAIDTQTGSLSWDIELGMRPESRCCVINGRSIYLFGANTLGKFEFLEINIEIQKIVRRINAPYSKFLFIMDSTLFLAGVDGIYRLHEGVFSLYSALGVLGYCNWNSEHWMLLSDEESIDSINLIQFQLGDAHSKAPIFIGNAEANQWNLTEIGEDAMLASNSSSFEMVLISRTREHLHTLLLRNSDDFLLVHAVKLGNNFYFLVDDKASGDYKVARKNEVGAKSKPTILAEIESPRFIRAVGSYLLVGGLGGITLWDESELTS